jgi:hypothetical protein
LITLLALFFLLFVDPSTFVRFFAFAFKDFRCFLGS